jgi:hypothetical protein
MSKESGSSSEYAFEWDLKDADIKHADVASPSFIMNGNRFFVQLEKREGNRNYLCILHPKRSNSVLYPGPIHIEYDLVNKLDNTIVKTKRCNLVFYKLAGKRGANAFLWIKPETFQNSILKVKIWPRKNFSEIVEKPGSFKDSGFLLFDKMYSNLSFKVGDEEEVFVLQKILTERSETFRVMLEGYLPGAGACGIPIFGIEADVFKMIIEWIYSMEIKQLDGMSPSLLKDLERVYIAADMYNISDLCEYILKYLDFLINKQTFGDIYLIAKKIGCVSLEKAVLLSWATHSSGFNKNDVQINSIIFEDEDVVVDTKHDLEIKVKLEGGENIERVIETEKRVTDKDLKDKETAENAKIVDISQKIIHLSEWDGEIVNKTCLITCLTSLLSVKDGSTKKRRIEIE